MKNHNITRVESEPRGVFAYVRRSSEPDDRQILSNESQVKELTDFAQKRGLEISKVFQESRSAKTPGRPILNEMLDRIERGEAKCILCWKLDRLARNPVDGGRISWMLQQGVITSIQTPEREYLPADNVILMSVELGMANQFVRDLSHNVVRGMKTKVAKGWRPCLAPLGYLNDKTKDQGERDIIADSERFDVVRRLWDLMLSGAYTVPQIWRIAQDDLHLITPKRKKIGGKPVSINAVYSLFTNVFYTGKFEYNGQLYQGSHTPMVTEDEFWRVQTILGKKGRTRPKHHHFPFTGLIVCGECGGMITAEEHVKANKGDGRVHNYCYYRCSKRRPGVKCAQPAIPSAELERQIEGYLIKVQISDDFHDWAIKYIRLENKKEVGLRTKVYDAQRREYEAAQKQLDELLNMRLARLVDDEEYLAKKERLSMTREQAKVGLQKAESRADHWFETAEQLFNFARYAQEWFKKGDLQTKKTILQTIGLNLTLKDKKLTIDVQEPLLLIEEGAKNLNWYA